MSAGNFNTHKINGMQLNKLINLDPAKAGPVLRQPLEVILT